MAKISNLPDTVQRRHHRAATQALHSKRYLRAMLYPTSSSPRRRARVHTILIVILLLLDVVDSNNTSYSALFIMGSVSRPPGAQAYVGTGLQ